ncbi:hypothetical protein JN11_03259 [Mucilaginibacter frigoritolerans]|uniref:Uncharacterized protein n=1 Tax=Mucilaginibacter frigoritolerans TaxID=652788 RepID=A0A562TZC7_9SPHI|nr:hypothetical protein [Mucilaginibacter frigoritolerans]TWI98180.1 hypothetical protein JN11_03259 [Mucilaginibacter frigoritolerans]
MKKLLFLLLLFNSLTSAFSQQNTDQSLWHLIVVDSLSNHSLARVTIAINKTHYYSTSINGSVNIDKSYINRDSRLRISCIGYSPFLLKIGSAALPDTIRLARSITLLHEVKISPYKPQPVTWGYFKTKHIGSLNSSPNNESAEYFPNDAKVSGTIASVDFELNDRQHAIEKPFGVEVLSRSDDSIFPDTALITDSIIVYNPEKKPHVSVDLSKYHIQVPKNGFFIVFETLDDSYYEKGTIYVDNYMYSKTPAINIFLTKKDGYSGECCDPIPPKLTGPYCMTGNSRKEYAWYVKTDQWIIYQQGINFAIKVTITPN